MTDKELFLLVFNVTRSFADILAFILISFLWINPHDFFLPVLKPKSGKPLINSTIEPIKKRMRGLACFYVIGGWVGLTNIYFVAIKQILFFVPKNWWMKGFNEHSNFFQRIVTLSSFLAALLLAQAFVSYIEDNRINRGGAR